MPLNIDRFALGCERRLHYRLGHRGMRMHGFADFDGGGLQRLAQHDLGNQVGRVMADDLAPSTSPYCLLATSLTKPSV